MCGFSVFTNSLSVDTTTEKNYNSPQRKRFKNNIEGLRVSKKIIKRSFYYGYLQNDLGVGI